MRRTLATILLLGSFCGAAWALHKDDTLVFRLDADGNGNSLWILNHTRKAPDYLDGSMDTAMPWGAATDEAPVVGDVDGDGLDDIMVVRKDDLGYFGYLAAHSSAGPGGVGVLANAVTSTAALGQESMGTPEAFYLADVNGDGRDDIVFVFAAGAFGWYAGHSDPNGVSTDSHSEIGTGWGGPAYDDVAALMGDFNGDGYVDVCPVRVPGGFWIPAFSDADGLGNDNWTYNPASPLGEVGDTFLVGDINGDGRTDGIAVRDADPNGPGSAAHWYVGFSNASGQVGGDGIVGPVALGLETDDFVVADINGDGRDDIGAVRDGVWMFGLTDASGNPAPNGVDVTQTFGEAGDMPLVGDFDILVQDFDFSGCADGADLAQLVAAWLTVGPDQVTDLDGDGDTDIVDYGWFAFRWMECDD